MKNKRLFTFITAIIMIFSVCTALPMKISVPSETNAANTTDVSALKPEDSTYIFIKSVEGCDLNCFWDVKQWTIGYGNKCPYAHNSNGTYWHQPGGHSISESEARSLFSSKLSGYVNTLKSNCSGLSMTQNQFDALLSATYNHGNVNNCPLKYYLQGKLTETEAREQYYVWHINAGTKDEKGLRNRRKKEADLFFSDMPDPDPPTYSNLTANKTMIAVGEEVTFTASSDYATGFTIGIDNEIGRYLTQGMENGRLTLTFNQTGNYGAYVTSYNSAGYKDSNWINFRVYDSSAINIGDSFYAKIKNQNNSLYFTNTGSTVNGQTASDSDNQIWKFERQEDNSYKIISKIDELPMDVLGAETTDGTDIRTWTNNDSSAQRYYIYNKFNSYYIRPVCSDKFVDMAINEVEHNVATWSYGADFAPQKFDIEKIDAGGALPISIGDSFYAKIKNQSNSLYLTNTGSTVNGQTVSDSDSQIWKFERQADNSYKIISQIDGLPMDVLGSETADGTDIRTWTNNDSSAQRYYIYNIFNSYYIRPLCSDKFVDMAIKETGHNVAIWSYGADFAPQKFDIEKIDAEGVLPINIGDSFYAKIKNQSSNLYFTNTGATINGQTASNSDNHIWKFEHQADNSYKIISQYDGLPMDVLGAETSDGTDIRTWTDNGLSAQRYYIYNIFNSYYIRPLCSDKFLDMSVKDTGHNVATWSYIANAETQKFDIENVDLTVKKKGDINNDGELTVADAVLLKKWLLAVPNTKLVNWKAADLYEDNRIDVFDMIEMRKLIINSQSAQ